MSLQNVHCLTLGQGDCFDDCLLGDCCDWGELCCCGMDCSIQRTLIESLEVEFEQYVQGVWDFIELEAHKVYCSLQKPTSSIDVVSNTSHGGHTAFGSRTPRFGPLTWHPIKRFNAYWPLDDPVRLIHKTSDICEPKCPDITPDSLQNVDCLTLWDCDDCLLLGGCCDCGELCCCGIDCSVQRTLLDSLKAAFEQYVQEVWDLIALEAHKVYGSLQQHKPSTSRIDVSNTLAFGSRTPRFGPLRFGPLTWHPIKRFNAFWPLD